MALQADGKIVVAGDFITVNGLSRTRIARLNADGTPDDFNPIAQNYLTALAVQSDGKIVLGGHFTSITNQTRRGLARVHSDGSIDMTFNSSGTNVQNERLALQANGQILRAGGFNADYGRVNADGTLDETFIPTANGFVYGLALQPDGKIIVGGTFTTLGGQPRERLGRLNPDGTLDEDFNPTANDTVECLALQADGKILVGGSFTNINGAFRQRLARLNPDGSLDTDFNPGASGTVFCFALQSDGQILAGGTFISIGGLARNRIARLQADGTVDNSFNPGASSAVLSLAIQADGRILAAGGFTTLGGQPRNYIGRLLNNVPPIEHLVMNDSVLTWHRSGGGAEFLRTSFEFSLNGSEWNFLGEGTRIPGGWQLADVSLPPEAKIRARGYAANNSWFLNILSEPQILVRPQSQNVVVGTNATFTVVATGLNLEYQWLSDNVIIPGATNSSLTLTNINESHRASYSVVVSNAEGSVTSSPPAVLRFPLTVFTLAGRGELSGTNEGTGSAARFNLPWDIAVDNTGIVYVADRSNLKIRKITPQGIVSTLAQLEAAPGGVTVDAYGNVYAVEIGTLAIRKITPDGAVSTVTTNLSSFPTGAAVDAATNIYVAVWGDHTIRKIDPEGNITLLAGTPGVFGSTDGTGSNARFNGPEHLALDSLGNLFVADANNSVIRKITPAGVVSTFAGVAGMTGTNDGFGAAARFGYSFPTLGPKGIAVDSEDNVFVADSGNSTIRRISPVGEVTTLLGLPRNTGTNDGAGSAVRFKEPTGIAVDAAGTLYIADTRNHTIRKSVPNFGQPIITVQPANQTVEAGSNATFTVNVLGLSLAYQWRYGTNEISGATNSFLTVTNAGVADIGTYSVLVSNPHGSELSAGATLGILRSPRFDSTSGFQLATNGFSLNLSGLSGHGDIVLFVSTNLLEWEPILTNPPVTGTLQMLDSSATNFPSRFYWVEER